MSEPAELTGPDLAQGIPLAQIPEGELFAAHAFGKPNQLSTLVTIGTATTPTSARIMPKIAPSVSTSAVRLYQKKFRFSVSS